MRRLLAFTLSLFERWLDDTIDPAKLRSFMKKNIDLIPAQSVQLLLSIDTILIESGFEFLKSDVQFSSALSCCKSNPSCLIEKMEALLRHVEVRRKTCFKATGMASSQLWCMRHRAAIMLCSYCRQVKDLRFLNTSLKLNDWAYPRYRSGSHHKDLPLYITALQEQETAIQELLS